ncbi:hypothetical protein [Nonomuraea jabiensis]|uniref:hypothetical protein n=1 Tax=Nonomuraea jabiensis TaxID=882448 RepID=UPI003D73EEA4
MDDAGFDASVLSEFRSRVIAHELEEKPLDLLLSALQERGLLAAGGKQRTDSTHVISALHARLLGDDPATGQAVLTRLASPAFLIIALAPDILHLCRMLDAAHPIG